MTYHACVELPPDPEVILIIVHDRDRFVSVPVDKSHFHEGDTAAVITHVIERAERDLDTTPRIYRGEPGERY